MKCNKCLYKKNCQFLLKHKNADVSGCTAFKDEADFRKVTRCEKCKYAETCEQYLYIDSNRTELVYCSYGERSDT